MNEKLTSTYSEQELENIMLKQYVELIYKKEFISRYNAAYNELYEDYKEYDDDDWIEEDPLKEDALNLVLNYFKIFNEQLSLGHSEKWSRLYTEYLDEEERTIYDLYNKFCKTDEEFAKKELAIIAKSIKNEQHVIDYYINLFEIGDGGHYPKERTKKYAEIYEQQIKNNKSKIFADRYADLMSGGTFVELYCFHFATKYEELLINKKDENYADIYSEKYADHLTNAMLRREIYEEDIGVIIEIVEEEMKKDY